MNRRVRVLALALPVLTISALTACSSAAKKAPSESLAQAVKTFKHPNPQHVDVDVTYTESPPTGGDHNGIWQKCAVYDAPLKNEHAVHSLEHGAVWLAYRPDLAASDVAKLAALAKDRSHVLVSPYKGLTAPVVASAWETQFTPDGVDDPRLAEFVRQYEEGPQTPELGAPCDGPNSLDKATG